ncbi:MAG: universal stress protein [Deltaproteobacteria bacterium]|nr:universal stress protein [Deltaproteobacteria bacterium]
MNGQICSIEKMERVLVATDGSETGQGAVTAALELVRILSTGPVELLAVAMVLTNLEYESAMPWVIAQAEKEVRQKLEPVKSMAEEAGIEFEIVVHRGDDPSAEIVGEAVRTKVDMIIMGTHGRTGIKRFLLGSVTGNVIENAPCKVLVVPHDAKVDFKTVLVATDGSRHGDAALSAAIAIAKRCNSLLVIVSAASSDTETAVAEETVKRALEIAGKEDGRKEGVVLHGKPEQVIMEVASQKNAGLIVMGSHGRTGIKSLVMGSVTAGVLSHGSFAVLVAKTLRYGDSQWIINA